MGPAVKVDWGELVATAASEVQPLLAAEALVAMAIMVATGATPGMLDPAERASSSK